MIQLYAITDHSGPPLPDVPPLVVVARGALAAICGLAPRRGDGGHIVASRGRLLEANHDQLLRSLEFVRDAAEVSVRVLDANGKPRSPSKTNVRAVVAQADAAQAVHEPLSALAQAQIVRPVLPGEMLRAAYLVKQNAVERFSAVARQLQIAHPSWQITFTGPGRLTASRRRARPCSRRPLAHGSGLRSPKPACPHP